MRSRTAGRLRIGVGTAAMMIRTPRRLAEPFAMSERQTAM
jgi:hypothetical protein